MRANLSVLLLSISIVLQLRVLHASLNGVVWFGTFPNDTPIHRYDFVNTKSLLKLSRLDDIVRRTMTQGQ